MASPELKNKTLSGIFWNFAQKLVNQSFHFIVTVVLARLLMPEDYGVVAIAGMFTALLGIFMNGGLGAALIQKKDTDELDFNTVFFMGLGMSFVLYTIIFFTAPLMAIAYDSPQLTAIIRVLALGLPIGALGSVQGAYVSRRMEFKKF
ncbi:MAG: oligosaccharide flippase family protein, partial [Bacteroidales bacterium]|nr:oligosaccharide flippase family protein [Bacteroidales bacterium]